MCFIFSPSNPLQIFFSSSNSPSKVNFCLQFSLAFFQSLCGILSHKLMHHHFNVVIYGSLTSICALLCSLNPKQQQMLVCHSSGKSKWQDKMRLEWMKTEWCCFSCVCTAKRGQFCSRTKLFPESRSKGKMPCSESDNSSAAKILFYDFWQLNANWFFEGWPLVTHIKKLESVAFWALIIGFYYLLKPKFSHFF